MEKQTGKTGQKYQRRPTFDLRKYHTIFLQVGLIITLLIFIGVTKIQINPSGEAEYEVIVQEIVQMEEIIQTRQEPAVPPPPRPQVPVAVPNDEIIEDIEITINADFSYSDQFMAPPPPPTEIEDEEPDFFIAVEQMPELIGGLQSIQQRIVYPEMARRAGIEGRVIVQFIINERGEVENPVVVRSIGGGCDEEAVRVIREANYKPGMQRGRPVRVQYSIPVSFVLQK